MDDGWHDFMIRYLPRNILIKGCLRVPGECQEENKILERCSLGLLEVSWRRGRATDRTAYGVREGIKDGGQGQDCKGAEEAHRFVMRFR